MDDDVAAVDDWSAAHRPATDPEALLLCALMWSAHTGGVSTEDQRITATVTADDFDGVAYRRIFVVIAGLVAAGEPYDPASVTAAFMRSGSSGAKDAPLLRSLNEVITAGADGFTAVHYADIVLSQAYRRSYRTVAAAIVHAAEELPEEYLSGSRAVLSHEYPAQSVKGISVGSVRLTVDPTSVSVNYRSG